MPFTGAYAATKFAVEAISDSMRVELRPWRIHVACIEPGSIATPLWDRGLEAGMEQMARWPAEAHGLYGEYIPRMVDVTQRTARAGIPPARVADAVEHALTASRPKTRYLVGNDARAQALLRAVPDKTRDALFGRYLGLKAKD